MDHRNLANTIRASSDALNPGPGEQGERHTPEQRPVGRVLSGIPLEIFGSDRETLHSLNRGRDSIGELFFEPDDGFFRRHCVAAVVNQIGVVSRGVECGVL